MDSGATDLSLDSPEATRMPEKLKAELEPLRKVFSEDQLRQIYPDHLLDSNRDIPRDVTRSDVEALRNKAEQNQRHRSVLTVTGPFDNVQKFYNGILPGSYVRPHMQSNSWEYLEIVEGKLKVLFFSPQGELERIVELGEDRIGVDIPPNKIHSVINEEYALLFEMRSGPYLIPAERKAIEQLSEIDIQDNALEGNQKLFLEAEPKRFLASTPSEKNPEAGIAYLQSLLKSNQEIF